MNPKARTKTPLSVFVLLLLLCLRVRPALPAGAQAPPVWFRTCDGQGRPFDTRSLRGQVVALSFASRYTSAEAKRVFAVLGAQARPGQVATIGVIDFVGIPRLLRGYARRKVQESDDPARTKLLVDEHSALRGDLMTEPDKRVDILILDKSGALRGRYVGEQQVPEALALLQRLVAEPAPTDPFARSFALGQ